MRVLLLLALPAVSFGCASANAPIVVAGAPRAASAFHEISLDPPPAALRAAGNVKLTGRELGTMWTFENPPLDYWKTEYGFTPTQEWLDHVRLSSARFGEFCSAAFVSPDGLALTNHHCARACIEAASTHATDHIENGFYAKDASDERVCPGLFLDQLVAIEDLTAKFGAAIPASTPTPRAAAIRDSLSRAIEATCRTRDGEVCQVVALFRGGQYQLYRYRRFQPVKLVFAPELQAGFFGGDTDNFTYPRHALDVTFVRAYRADGKTPATTPRYFRWRAGGASEGELVFVTGNPGSTSRLISMSQVMYERQYKQPFLLHLLGGQHAFLERIAAIGPDARDEVRQDMFELENSLKAYRGQLAALRDTTLLAVKVRWERDLRESIDADPKLRAAYGDVWDRLATIERAKLRTSPRLNVANSQVVGAPQLVLASQLVQYVHEKTKAAPALPADHLHQMERVLASPTSVDDRFSVPLLALQIDIASTWLSPEDPLRRALIEPDETPLDAARRLTMESRVQDSDYRRRMIEGGVAALESSSDPLVRYAVLAEPIRAELYDEWQRLVAEENTQNRRLAEALFAVRGTMVPPDATFTLRISDGVISRYPHNGTFAPPVTTFYGLYARSAEFDNAMPWKLPELYERRRSAVDLATPLNVVSTVDITGGNSGSPLIDREARLVGVVFDGNMEQLANEFVYRAETGRTIAVHSAGITEALRNIYRAWRLVEELMGSNGTTK
jgi:hypothetical protein